MTLLLLTYELCNRELIQKMSVSNSYEMAAFCAKMQQNTYLGCQNLKISQERIPPGPHPLKGELNLKFDFSSFEHLGIVEQLYEVLLSC